MTVLSASPLPMFRTLFPIVLSCVCSSTLQAQQRAGDPLSAARNGLIAKGVHAKDLAELRVTDSYVDAHGGIRHTWFRQQWQGIDIFGSEVAVHQRPNGDVVALTHGLVEQVEAKAGS